MSRARLLAQSVFVAIAVVLVWGCSSGCSHASPIPSALPDCDGGSQCGSFGITGGSGGGTQPEAGGQCGSIVSADAVCNACLANMCCARNEACSASADCLAIVTCVKACLTNDAACVTRCENLSQNGVSAYQNFFDCTVVSCQDQCQPIDGGSCGTSVSANAACALCVAASCCGENAACVSNAACLALWACASSCQPTDQACITGCETTYPNGDAAYRSLSQCVLSACSANCP